MDEAQLDANSANNNRYVTRVRNIVERVNSVVIKKWGPLGGKVMHWRFVKHSESLVRIACALHNRFKGCLDPQQGAMDESDYSQTKAREGHQNEIPDLIDDENLKFEAVSDVNELKEKVPDMDTQQIRQYATGPYALYLSMKYLVYARALSRNIKVQHAQIGRNKRLVKATGLKSRFRSQKQRTVHLLYTKKRGLFQLTDTLCNCDGGKRVIGGCAHSIAVLRFVDEQKTGTEKLILTQSEQELMDCFDLDFSFDSDSDDDCD